MVRIDAVDIQLLLVIIFYVICCPYTKVEESFNMQAVFDISTFGFDIKSYDHLEFPGVVPRTFIGSLLLNVLYIPLKYLIAVADLPGLYNQIAIRCVLGAVCWLSYAHFRNGVAVKFGKRASQLTGVLTAFQFHICFYMTRTLPNVFALALCLNAFAFWLKGRPLRCIALMTAATVIFRCDILVLLGPLTLQLLISKEIAFVDTVYVGIATGAAALALTVIVDSLFWQRLVWPEGVVLFFNTVQNRSSEWGVMPYHWYFSHALLKALNLTIPWIAVGLFGFSFPKEALLKTADGPRLGKALYDCLFGGGINAVLLYYIAPAMAFVLLYSNLPHKELRFIFPALPLLTMAGGVGLDSLLPADSTSLVYPLNLLHPDPHTTKMKKLDRQRLMTLPLYRGYRYLTSAAVLVTLAGMTVIASGLVTAAHRNYPGAEALDRLVYQHVPMYLIHHSEDYAEHLPQGFRPLFVHIDAATAMTGVTRFLQRRFSWTPPLAQKHDLPAGSGYLNLSPQHFNPHATICFEKPDQCDQTIDLLFYSKDENVTDYTGYDWIITADPKVPLSSGQFEVAEEISSYHSIRPTWSGFVVNLKTELYILVNIADE